MAKNTFTENFLGQIKERFSDDSTSMPMSEWICKNTTLRNRPFSFKGYEFQKQIVDDMHPDMDVIKISQVGLTEVQIRKACAFLIRNNGTSLIFTLPNEDMYKRVSNSRIKPIINKDKVFNTVADHENKSVRSVDMMQFGQSFLYITPVLESAATSIPADAIFNDELDLSDMKIVSLFSSRLQNSKFKIKQRFSTPTFPSYGIDLNWQSSDQHLYMCQCDHCGHWQHPEFTEDFVHLAGRPDKPLTEITENFKDQLDFSNSYIKCQKCALPLDLADPSRRQWAATFANRKDSRGYRIGPFSNDKLDLQYIYKSMWNFQKEEFMRGFYNTVLGQPYTDGSIQIPEEDILACMTNNINTPTTSAGDDIWVGIDMGNTCHITLGRGPNKDNLEILSIYTVHVDNIVEHCKSLVKDYNIRGGAVDRHPFEPISRDIFKQTGGRIVPVEYRGMKDVNIVQNEFKELSHAQVNHTWFLDNLASKIRKRKLPISGYGIQKRVFIQHLRDMVREETPGEPATWSKLTKNDHYFHSSAFMCVAPHVAEVIRLNSQTEFRTVSLGCVAQLRDGAGHLAGVTKKRLEKPIR